MSGTERGKNWNGTGIFQPSKKPNKINMRVPFHLKGGTVERNRAAPPFRNGLERLGTDGTES